MTDHTQDPIDVLRSHVRSVALLERPETSADDLIASIIDGSSFQTSDIDVRSVRSNVVSIGSPRRRRWLVAASTVAIVAVGGAGVAAYVGSRPSKPTADLLCRGSATGAGSSVAVALGDDPIGQCAELWRSGVLPDVDRPAQATAQVPRLVACTGSNGSVEVLPLDELVGCADVGLSDAALTGLAEDPVLSLQRELAVTVNGGPCRSARVVEGLVRDALDDAELSGWTVDVVDPNSACATVAVDFETTRAIVRSHPSESQPKENP